MMLVWQLNIKCKCDYTQTCIKNQTITVRSVLGKLLKESNADLNLGKNKVRTCRVTIFAAVQALHVKGFLGVSKC